MSTDYISGRLATVSNLPYLRVYDMPGLNKLPDVAAVSATGASVRRVAYSPDGRFLAVGFDAAPYLLVLDPSGAVAANLSASSNSTVTCAAFSPDGSYLAVTYSATPYLRVYDTASWSVAFSPATELPTTAKAVAFSPDGTRLAVGHAATNRLTVWAVGTWVVDAVINTGNRPAGSVNGVAYSPDGTMLACAHFNAPRITVYNTTTWSKVVGPTSTALWADCVAFSADSSELALGHPVTTTGVTRFDTTSWAVKPALADPPVGGVLAVAYSPDGAYIAMGSDSGTEYLYVYETASGSRLPHPTEAPGYWVRDVAFGPTITPTVLPFWTNKIKTTEIV